MSKNKSVGSRDQRFVRISCIQKTIRQKQSDRTIRRSIHQAERWKSNFVTDTEFNTTTPESNQSSCRVSEDQDQFLRRETRTNTWGRRRKTTCCVSVQGLRPLKDSAFVVFEGESFRETLLTSSAVVKCDGLVFGTFPGCVTRCFTLTSRFLQPRPRKWRSTPRNVAIFSLSVFFFGHAKNPGICEAAKDRSGASSTNREKKKHLEELQTGTELT